MPHFSVVIPAHNEDRVIGRCLNGFVRDLASGEAEVIVAANGCTDDTARLAGAHLGVRVLDLPVPSKAAALNAADAAATALPRIYLDADIVIDAHALRRLATVLATDGVCAASPRIHFRTEGRSWVVRQFYEMYEQLPYIQESLLGGGVYGLSARGRARFEQFPALVADDLFVQRQFTPEERLVVSDITFDVQTPRSLRGLLAVRTRTAYGNRQLEGALLAENHRRDERFAASSNGTARALLARCWHHPRQLPAAVVYAVVTAVARRRAARRTDARWDRDDSTR